MKKNIVMVVSGFLILFFFNGAGCHEPPIFSSVVSRIELSGLQYDIVKIEISEFSENINEFYYHKTVLFRRSRLSEELKSRLSELNGKQMRKTKKPIIIKGPTKYLHYLSLNFSGFSDDRADYESSLGSTYSYRLKVDTDGLEANKNLFDKKIEFTSKDDTTYIRIDIANKKVKIVDYYDY